MSITQGSKLRLIRNSEQLTKRQLTDLIGIVYTTYHGYEMDKSKMTLESAVKLFGHPRFHKYQDWFMYDKTDPAKGQIAPALALYTPDETDLSR
ncbi:XRE family transcriptional regulator [Yersinia enterocolitica]